MIVTAMADRCEAPAPMPIAVGIRPATIDNVVIRIGRSRTRFASMIAVVNGSALVAQLVHVVDLQNAVLLHDSQQQQDAQSAEQVQRSAGGDQRQQRKRNRQRQGRAG